MSVSFTSESYVPKEKNQVIRSTATLDELTPNDDPIGYQYVEIQIQSITNLPFEENSAPHELIIMLKGPYGDYLTPAVQCSDSQANFNDQIFIELKNETQPNLEIVVLERKKTDMEELCRWEAIISLFCKPNEWSDVTEKMTCSDKYAKHKRSVVPTLSAKLWLSTGKSCRRLLPGQIKFGLEYNFDKDLKRCQHEYSEKFSPLIKQEFEKTTVEDKHGVDSIEISILQFNMLADALCTAYTEGDSAKEFIGVDKQCLRWSYRGLRIVELLLQMNTDIICLEECDQSEFLIKYLSNTYECLHQPKSKAPARHIFAQLQEERKNDLPKDFKISNDGIFIAFKKDKFEKIGEETRIKDDENEDKVVALAVRLRPKGRDRTNEFMLIGTHLKSEKSEQGEKLRQNQIRYLLNYFSSNVIPTILMSDLNANPIVNKKGYEPLCYGEVKSFGFESAYVKGQGKNPDFTTYKKRPEVTDKHTIDYIFVKTENWTVTELLQIKDQLEMDVDYSVIPNWNYPSDHFAIGCKLQWSVENPIVENTCNCTIM